MKGNLKKDQVSENSFITFSRLKEEFQLIKRIDIGSYNRKFPPKEVLTFIDIIYYIFIFICCLLFLKACFLIMEDINSIILNLLLIVPFCLFIMIPFKESLRAIIFLAFGAKSLQIKNKKSFLLTCVAPIVRDRVLQLMLSIVPLIIINVSLVLAYIFIPALSLMTASALISYSLYSIYDVEVINVVLLNWKKKIFSYFDAENTLLIFAK